MKFILTLFFSISVSLSYAQDKTMSITQGSWHYTEPTSLDDGWKTIHLNALDVDTTLKKP